MIQLLQRSLVSMSMDFEFLRKSKCKDHPVKCHEWYREKRKGIVLLMPNLGALDKGGF